MMYGAPPPGRGRMPASMSASTPPLPQRFPPPHPPPPQQYYGFSRTMSTSSLHPSYANAVQTSGRGPAVVAVAAAEDAPAVPAPAPATATALLSRLLLPLPLLPIRGAARVRHVRAPVRVAAPTPTPSANAGAAVVEDRLKSRGSNRPSPILRQQRPDIDEAAENPQTHSRPLQLQRRRRPRWCTRREPSIGSSNASRNVISRVTMTAT